MYDGVLVEDLRRSTAIDIFVVKSPLMRALFLNSICIGGERSFHSRRHEKRKAS